MKLVPFSNQHYHSYKSWFDDPQVKETLGDINTEWLEYILKDKGGKEHAVLDDGSLVAVIGIIFPSTHHKNYVISNIAVDPLCRRKGIASRALSKILGNPEFRESDRWLAYVDPKNTITKKFFIANGWTQQGIDNDNMIVFQYSQRFHPTLCFMLEDNRLNLNEITLGGPIPDWSLDPIFGESVPLVESYRGKPLLILIFSLGCPGCLGRAIPYANRVVFENEPNINVVGIHTNFEGVDYPQIKFEKAREEFFIRFPFYKDHNFDTTFLKYGAGGTPHWILVDSTGNVEYSIFGSDPNNALLRLDLKIIELMEKEDLK